MKKIKAFAERHATTYVIEEVEPFIEEQMKAAGIRCIGKAVLPVMGEYSTRLLEERILGKKTPKFEFNRELLVPGLPPFVPAVPIGASSMSWAKSKTSPSTRTSAAMAWAELSL